ncbi:hypothetical protein M3F29_01745, partial [Kocuria rhizophila]|nr:hypothetical protein [Kocuria rhizophila]
AWRSKTIRTARSRNSGVNFMGMIRFSFRKLGTKPRALQSMPTVKTHVGNLLAKTSARDRVQLVLFALRTGLAVL